MIDLNFGIETNYKGIIFRSRLEAKWAMFFDEVGWDWTYEPIDLQGWIPDFIIYGEGRDVLIEVKPFSKEEEWNNELKIIEKAIKNTKYDCVLLLGSKINKKEVDSCGIGWVYDKHYWIDEAILTYYNGYDFAGVNGSYENRLSKIYDGDHFYFPIKSDLVVNIWNRCINKSKWNKK